MNSTPALFRLFKIPLLLFLLPAFYSSAGWAAEKYRIKLEYPAKAGQKYHLRVRGSDHDRKVISTAENTNRQTKELSVELEGTIEVLEVDTNGHEKKITCVVEKCLAGEGREKKELLKKGDSFVLSEEKGQKTFSQDGVELPIQTAQALGIVLSVQRASEDEDDIFGTKDLKAVGESWPINASAAMASLKGLGNPITPRNLEGTCRLEGLKTVKGEAYLDISATMKSEISLPPNPGMRVREATMQGQFTGLFSSNNSRRPAKETESMKMVLKIERENAAGASELISERTVEKEIDP